MKKIVFVLLLFVAFGGFVLADTTSPPTPAGTPSAGNPLGGVGGVYTTALAVGGLLAFGAIVYAAIQYALARGNPGMQSDAREGITQAILGLLLLIGAFLVLRTINPKILTPSIAVEQLNIQSTAPPQNTTSTTPTCGGTPCPPPYYCNSYNICVYYGR